MLLLGHHPVMLTGIRFYHMRWRTADQKIMIRCLFDGVQHALPSCLRSVASAEPDVQSP
jgi:hypothetical protein